MRILLVMDPGIKVPPSGYGGHERLVFLMAKEYQALGHEVHLLVTEGSEVPGCIIHGFGKEQFPPTQWQRIKAIIYVWWFLLKNAGKFDLIHNFGRLAFLLPVLTFKVKKIMTYGRVIDEKNIKRVHQLPNRNLIFTGASNDLISRIPQIGEWHAVHNAIDFSQYQAVEHLPDDAPLIFLGRLERFKGCHTAIQVARASNRKLVIAGNISPLADERAYFENEIKPEIDGSQIMYVGALNDAQKNEWLGKSKALLFPIEGIEAFGIVMIEAMACGTPVIAFRLGSVDEVVEDGLTGIKVNNLEEMIHACDKIGEIDRSVCRKRAESRFNVKMIAGRYLSLIENPKPKVLIVTTGQPSSNPRVMKEYQALKSKGFLVKVVYPYSAAWAYELDEIKFRNCEINRGDFILAGGSPFSKRLTYFVSKFIFKCFKLLSKITNHGFIQSMSLSDASFKLWRKINGMDADLILAHYIPAIPAALRAKKFNNALAIFDAEDYHRGEEAYYVGMTDQIIQAENNYFPKFDVITTASPLITDAYKSIFPDKNIFTINNVFSKSSMQATFKENDGGEKLKLFWFSQYIGPKRGLDVIFKALNLINDPNIELHLLGDGKYSGYIKSLMETTTCRDSIFFHSSVNEQEIFQLSSGFDVGMASEIPFSINRNICLTNKIFTYLIAGNCILASDTAAQSSFMSAHPGIGFVYNNDSPEDLADKIRMLKENPALLKDCRRQSLKLAKEKLNWETESIVFISVIEDLLLNHGKRT